MSCWRTWPTTALGNLAALVSAAVSWICARDPASVMATTFRRLAQAASCDTATPTTSSNTNMLTSAELRIVNRLYGRVKKKSNQTVAPP
jgi:hypothetical protein